MIKELFRHGLTTLLALVLITSNLIWLAKDVQRAEVEADLTKQYSLLSKRIFTENQDNILINFRPLRASIHEYVSKKPNIGVYFEYLPSGTSIGVNANEELRIASLIKTPTVMAVYKEVEKGAINLDKKISLKKSEIDPRSGELWEKGEGASVTVKEAVDLALTKSDNTAHNTLLNLVGNDKLGEVFESLDIPIRLDDGYFIISSKNYTSILRSLYLSSYLQKQNSQAILTTLTKTEFSNQISAGVPKDIEVAHKIGIFDLQENDRTASGKSVFSDCGIVYVPGRPYSLCIMVSTDNEAEAVEYMQELSRMTYNYVSQAN